MITSNLLKIIAPATPKTRRDRFLKDFNEVLPRYQINSRLRVAAFLATVCLESDYFKATEEYASGRDYDISVNPKKARGLGNTEPGDGPRYKGRSLIQTTGRKNYQRVTDRIGTPNGVDFVKNPKKLAEPRWAVEAACVFWQDNRLNQYADRSDFFAVQGLVNRGDPRKKALHYEDRLRLFEKLLEALPEDFDLCAAPVPAAEEPPVPVPAVEIPLVEAAAVAEPAPYNNIGFWPTIKNDLKAVGAGNLTFQGMSEFVQQVGGLPPWLAPIVVKLALVVVVLSAAYLVFRVIHYAVDTYKKNQRMRLEMEANTALDRRDIQWVRAE